MTERGMIFNAEMVRAIRDGRKTQTRRIMKVLPKPSETREGDYWFSCNKMRTMVHVSDFIPGNCAIADAHKFFSRCCPFGAVGDRIWVRETWTHESIDAENGSYSPDYRATANGQPLDGRWTPSIHMPRWASRITLEITDVRVERLKEISEADARAEGIECIENNYGNGPAYRDYLLRDARDTAEWFSHANRSFLSLWHSIYGGESLAANPWVWVIEFRRVDGGAA